MNKSEIQKAISYADDLRDRKGDQIQAIKVLENTLGKLNADSDDYYLVGIKLSALYRDSISYEKAFGLLEQLLITARNKSKAISYADILRSKAFILLQQNRLSESLKQALLAKELIRYKRKDNVDEVKANIYAVLGNIYFTMVLYEEALVAYKLGIRFAKKSKFINRIITISSDIANVHIARGSYGKAELYLRKIEKEAKIRYKIAVPQILLRQANLLKLQGKNDAAIDVLEQALRVSRNENWKRDIAEVLLPLSEQLTKKKINGRAKEMLIEARNIYKSLGLESKAQAVSSRIQLLD
ncbi:hypothetical protein HYV12_03565 [Candidatus Dojkabacteria bacterium]|nr:hypothetical protein [Candidatus Dojkabacteria bacterium]